MNPHAFPRSDHIKHTEPADCSRLALGSSEAQVAGKAYGKGAGNPRTGRSINTSEGGGEPKNRNSNRRPHVRADIYFLDFRKQRGIDGSYSTSDG